MPLVFLFDENLGSELQGMVIRHNRVQPAYAMNALQVGDGAAPPKGTTDSELLVWCQENNRLLVTWDKRSMPGHLADHLASGRHSPGVFLVRPIVKISELVIFLATVAYASDADEWRDRCVWIP